MAAAGRTLQVGTLTLEALLVIARVVVCMGTPPGCQVTSIV